MITLPHGIDSESIFIRYVLDDQFGGWVQPRSETSAYLINTNQQGHSAARIKAVLYAPGCSIQTLDLPVSDSKNQPYSFVCQLLPSFTLVGGLTPPTGLQGREVKVKYVARWAQHFLGLTDNVTTYIPVGETQYFFADGTFRLSLPDLSKDPLAGSLDRSGDLQIIATDRASGKVVSQLVPVAQALRTRSGNLKIQDSYPAEVVFAPCSAQGFLVHDSIGFAIRGSGDVCTH